MEHIKEKIKKIKDEGKAIQKEIQKQTLGYVLAALGLIAGLAWNDAIKALIEYFFPLSRGTLFAKFAYAFLITAAVVLFSVYVIRFIEKRVEKDE